MMPSLTKQGLYDPQFEHDACGCDLETGDGAGILLQMPHQFFRQESAKLGFTLPGSGEYEVGLVFLPQDGARGIDEYLMGTTSLPRVLV